MPLRIFRSNRVETLQARLAQRLVAQPLADPFARETVVVPTYAMARWLNLGIARQQGIAANLDYPQPQRWLWSLATRLLDTVPVEDPCAADALAWPVFEALPDLLAQPAFEPLRRYLDDDDNGIKRWQLSQRIADCYDRYQSYRPDWIEGWTTGEQDDWQARLWRRVVTERGLTHRVATLRALRQRLDDASAAVALPQRVSLFAISRLAPAWLDIIHALAYRCEVLLFQHNPTDHYWADLVSEKQRARQRLDNPRTGDYLDSGNHLLTSWGRQGQALQDMLLDLAPVTADETEDSQAPVADNLLHALQASLFRLEQPSVELQAKDDSVSVHLCHSPMRECQVLHDRLLTLLDRHPELNSEDILVMVPDISRYAPYIEAVFQADASHRRPQLGWNLSDISVANGHPLVGVFLQLLNLPGCRFTHSEILSFLECAEIRAAFRIDAAMLDPIHRLVEDARVRWGIDADQRGELGLPRHHENTWQQAWQRIFAGYAMPDDSPWNGIAPLPRVDSNSGVAIAQFRQLFERLVYWRRRLASPAGANAWQLRLHQLIDEFFGTGNPDDDRLLPLRNAVGELGGQAARELDPELVRYWMEQQLASSQQPGHLYSGGVTFCGMQPMRNIPFAVICVLGMQDRDFPRRERPAEFDRLRGGWRPGDPHRGDEDRYLMLETLLCARRYLYFSYCARSLRDNSECQPSVLLRELLDYIDDHVIAGGSESASQAISQLHPMQPFSPRVYREPDPGYDPHWYDTACQLGETGSRPVAERWRRHPLEPVAVTVGSIDLDQLAGFFRHPLRFFYRHRLGIGLPRQDTVEDDEAFVLTGLQQWSVIDQLARQHLAGDPLQRSQFSARGLLPHGTAADAEWFRLMTEYRRLLENLDPYSGQAHTAQPVDCLLDGGRRLFGEARDYYPGLGLMHFSASKRPRAASLVTLWLHHLALCAGTSMPSSESSRLITAGSEGWRFEPIEPAEARGLLLDYWQVFEAGQDFPLPLFPDTSLAWAAGSSLEAARNAARRAWVGDRFRSIPGDRDDPVVRLALHGNPDDPLDDALFQGYAEGVFAPVLTRGAPVD